MSTAAAGAVTPGTVVSWPRACAHLAGWRLCPGVLQQPPAQPRETTAPQPLADPDGPWALVMDTLPSAWRVRAAALEAAAPSPFPLSYPGLQLTPLLGQPRAAGQS